MNVPQKSTEVQTPAGGSGALIQFAETAGMAIVLGVLLVVLGAFVPNFSSKANVIALLLSVSTVGIIACTMLFCLAAGDFDLSVGAVVAMSGVIAAIVANKTGSVTLGILAGCAAGSAVGWVNGFVIAKLGINALITTLATMQIVRGVAYIVCDGVPVGIGSETFWELGIGSFLGVPNPVWVMLCCFVFFGLLLWETTFGRNTLAIGGNAEAARLAGVAVVRTKIIIFTMQGLAASIAGIVLAARMTSGQPATAQGLELQVISACVLGGVSLTGGVGTIWGVMVGVALMGAVNNALNLMNVPTFYQYVASGAILLAAVIFDRAKQVLLRR